MAVLGVLTGIATGIGGFLGGSDPAKDRERFATIDRLKQEALADGLGSRSYVQLQCFAGIDSPEAIAFGFRQPDGPACRIGSDSALAYAKIAYGEVTARLKVGSALGTAGVGAIGVANELAPGSGTSALTGALADTVGGVPKIVLVVAIVAGAWLLLRKRR